MKLPITILSGYLGAGKTTLINRLLAEDHGLRLAVLVNDFGAVNIDADLLHSAEEDTVELTNGCVCCSIEGDLFDALNTILDRNPRPDHVILETSGVADPASIAAAAIAEPELSYGGIVTVVDAGNLNLQLHDTAITDHVRQQIAAADQVLVSKDDPGGAAMERLKKMGARNPIPVDALPVNEVMLDLIPLPKGRAMPKPHPAYVTWHHRSDTPISRAAMGEKLAARPEGLYRMKGFVLTDDGAYEVHVVGQFVQARRTREVAATELVALGPAAQISRDQIADWWDS